MTMFYNPSPDLDLDLHCLSAVSVPTLRISTVYDHRIPSKIPDIERIYFVGEYRVSCLGCRGKLHLFFVQQ